MPWSGPCHYGRLHYLNLTDPILPHHYHGGGVEFAVAHELAADGAAGGLVAGGEAIGWPSC